LANTNIRRVKGLSTSYQANVLTVWSQWRGVDVDTRSFDWTGYDESLKDNIWPLSV